MPPVGFYVLGVISILIVVSVICFRNKEGLTSAINVELLGTLRIITPELGGSATSHPIALSRPVLANELADFTPVDMFGSPTSHRGVSCDGLGSSANESILESKPASTSAPSSDSCPTGCTKPTTVAGNCAPITVKGVEKHVCPYVCTGDYNSGCQGLDGVCRDCGNVTLPETTPVPSPPKNKFLGMVVEFPSTSSKPSSKKTESPYIDTSQYCDGGKIYIHADSYNASSQEVTDEAECATKCDGDSSCQMMLMSSPTTCHLYRDVDNVSMHCKSIPGYAAYWGEVRSDRYKGHVEFPAGSSTSSASDSDREPNVYMKDDKFGKYYITSKGVLRKAGAGCTQRPIVLDVPLANFLSTNKFTLGTPLSDKDTCAAEDSPAGDSGQNGCSIM